MHALFVFVLLALSLGIVVKTVDAVLPLKLDGVLAGLKPAGLAILLAWGLNYNVFAAFGMHVRWPWEGPVMTGFALMAGAAALKQIAKHLPFSCCHK